MPSISMHKDGRKIGGCPRIGFYVISTAGRNLKLMYFQYNKISRYARNDRFAEFSDSLLALRCWSLLACRHYFCLIVLITPWASLVRRKQ